MPTFFAGAPRAFIAWRPGPHARPRACGARGGCGPPTWARRGPGQASLDQPRRAAATAARRAHRCCAHPRGGKRRRKIRSRGWCRARRARPCNLILRAGVATQNPTAPAARAPFVVERPRARDGGAASPAAAAPAALPRPASPMSQPAALLGRRPRRQPPTNTCVWPLTHSLWRAVRCSTPPSTRTQ
ncbi:MAG: hypothetical protein J3K34DRAFT_520632 [Monoraphidium minutum]|nr:MAG: hypothetical protein J3K34DRAFT_520632 [Monoraphidium minutum]